MKKYYDIQNKARSDEADIFLYQQIGDGMFSEGIGAKQFAADLRALGNVKRINLHINSPGGSVFEGLAIYNQLRAHKADKYIYIDGVAASIASVIAMAGTWVTMPENALLMLHDPTGQTLGSADDHRKTADTLDKVKQSIIAAYTDKTRMKREDIADMMSAETWLSAVEAKSLGFCDEVVQAVKIAAHFDLSAFTNVPEKIKNGGNTTMENIQAHQKDLLGERERVKALLDIGRQYNAQDIALRLIENGGSLEDMRAQVLAKLNAGGPPQPLSLSHNTGSFGGGSGNASGFRNFGDFLTAVVKAGTPGQKTDARLFLNAASGMSEGVPSEGGFAVPVDFSNEIFTKAYEISTLASRVKRIPVSGSGLKIPVVDETSRATGSRFGGVSVAWTGEGSKPTSSMPKLAQMELSLKKLMGLAYVTEELLSDAPAMQALVVDAFTKELAFMLDTAILRGTGAGQPLGIINANGLVTQAKETGQAADTIVFENVTAMWSRLWTPSKRNAIWLCSPSAWPQILTMTIAVGAAGQPAFWPNGAAGGPIGSIFGRPLIEMEQCSALGDLGDIVLVDPSEYILIEKAQTVDWSAHVRFEYHEQTFRITMRADGQPGWKAAVTGYDGVTQSPFVALAAR